MDSPESSKLTSTNCETAPAQDSPVFNFLSNLSPIQTVRAAPVTQGFPELNSPPLVFTSPQLNLHRRSAFLKRAHFPRASSSLLAGHAEDGKAYGKLNIQLSTRLEKATDSNCPENDSTESSAGSPEQFLADIVEGESEDPKFSNNSTSEKTECTDKPPDAGTGAKEHIVDHVCETNSRTSEQIVLSPDVIRRHNEEVLEENVLIDVNAMEKDTNRVHGVSGDHSQDMEHELIAVHALTNQTEEDIMDENVEAELADQSDQSCHFLSGSVEIGEEDEILAEATGAVLTEPALIRVHDDREAFQHRGVRRRCLQFEDAQLKVMSSQTTKSTLGIEELRQIALETSSTPVNSIDEVGPPILCPRNSLDSTIKIPKPSGIGLHLNSIVTAVKAGSGSKVSLRSAQWGNFSIVGKKSMHVNESHPVDCSNYSSMLPLVENLSATTDGNRHECRIILPNDSVISNSLEDQSTPGMKRKCTEKSGGSTEFIKSSPQKKRIKLSDPGEGGGCKRCNCKKSKCLKLYCDCFAAGIYCAEPCACQDCFNTPEHEATVIETRQKIESRDPLAFAPRVVQRVTIQPPSIHREDGTPFTPSSARHKRGCKCKKSMCLKKYCECYQQAKVGCSDGCRCEGCQNVFGQKEYCSIKDVLSEEDYEIADGPASDMAVNHTEVFNAHRLTPPTPAFQFSNHGKDASKSWFPSGEYSQSPETDFTYVAPYMISHGSPMNSDDINNNNTMCENSPEIMLDLDSFDHDLQSNLHHKFGGELSSGVIQDDTPEMLKDNSTPVNGVKVCSPNKKRVSPPHVRLHEFSGSSSSVGIRTGRKFILKAVPSFPPLTPCVDSKSADKSSEPQDIGANK
ncbi:Protein tesmin/TSO1-like CXC 2 [Striga hermonthica]|uniref:Protein tesmin/TSO1-like CXC 2 n=1 Tax=Striga hermonthica TaxID=68872 RepID=A0A9N7N665_STRHE|nr:Protein tesmin/TSO1-like CXC 2 [Striga hermonthica]